MSSQLLQRKKPFVLAVVTLLSLFAVACPGSSTEPTEVVAEPTTLPTSVPTATPEPPPEPVALPTRAPDPPPSPTATAVPAATSTPVPVLATSTPIPAPQAPAVEAVNVEVPINVRNAEALFTLHLELVFEPEVMSVTSVSVAGNWPDALLEYDASESGRVTVGMIGPTAFNGDGDIAVVNFLVTRPELASPIGIENVEAFGGSELIDILSSASGGRIDDGRVIEPETRFGL